MRKWRRQNADRARKPFGKAPCMLSDVIDTEDQEEFREALVSLLTDKLAIDGSDSGMDSLVFEIAIRLKPDATQAGSHTAEGHVMSDPSNIGDRAHNGSHLVADKDSSRDSGQNAIAKNDGNSTVAWAETDAEDPDKLSEHTLQRIREILDDYARWAIQHTVTRLSEWQEKPCGFHRVATMVNYNTLWCAVHKKVDRSLVDLYETSKRKRNYCMTTWHNVELVQYLAIAAEVQEVHLTDFVSKLIQEEDGGFGLCCSKEVAQYEAAPAETTARHNAVSKYKLAHDNFSRTVDQTDLQCPRHCDRVLVRYRTHLLVKASSIVRLASKHMRARIGA